MASKLTPHQKAEAELTKFALKLPETDTGPAWPPTRAVRVRGKMFCIFGEKAQGTDALTMIMKLPISAEMVQDLYFVRESKGWFKQHNWVIAHFGPEDDILEELDTLKAWITQSYCAMAPKKLAKLVRGEA
jgi:predicted DNA-binding protein (MmcQ/YjbR family)